MNSRLSLEFGQDLRAGPGSKKPPDIRNADALEIDWVDVLPLDECSYVFRQPPFGGPEFESLEQRAQVHRVAALSGSGGTLDYVTAWFIPAGASARPSRTATRRRGSASWRRRADARCRGRLRLTADACRFPLAALSGFRVILSAAPHVTVDDDSAGTGTDPVVVGRQALARLRESLEPADFPRAGSVDWRAPSRAPPVRTTETSVGNGIGGCRSLPARSTRAAIPGVGSPRESSSRSRRGLECHLHRGTGKNTCSRGRGAPGPLPRGVRDPPE